MIDLATIRADRSSYDTGRKRSGGSGKAYNKMKQQIIAIDGEGVTDPNGDHRYIILAASDGSHIAAHSLSTLECFEYLLGLPKHRLIVGFSINYDICKWLVSLKREKLETLWKDGTVWWLGYKIRWAPGKFIRIAHGKRSVLVYDVFGFYQQSFVKALNEWRVGTAEQVERITSMKASRSSFSEETIAEILGYCFEECTLLVELVEKLRSALIEGGITLNKWYGAGAIAAAIFEKEGVKEYIGRKGENGKPIGPPEKYSHPIISAYYGGRFEMHKSGGFQNVYGYDIRSAYPYVLSGLPCLAHVTWEELEGFVPTEYGIYRCEWDIPEGGIWGPFPFRVQSTRQIVYPLRGCGWYHASEVRAALKMYPDYIQIKRTIVIKVRCEHRPFAYVSEYFKYRAKLKAQGSQAQLTLKLGLNSMYGKTAQGVGWGDQKPPYQSYVWAAMITAGTRAMLLEAIAQSPDTILWTATDGIMSTAPLQLDVGNGLGEWEASVLDSAFSVQSGVYELVKDGKTEIKSRGFGKAETSFDEIKKCFSSDPVNGEFEYTTTRFVGLGAALMRTDFWEYFGKWKPMSRRVKFQQSKRWFGGLEDGVVTHLPSSGVANQDESAPYVGKSSWTDLWERETADDTLQIMLDSDQP